MDKQKSTFFHLNKATFYLDKNYTWIHCDEFFTGYYNLDYTFANWNDLATILKRSDTVNTFEILLHVN